MTRPYRIYIRPQAWEEIRALPGHVRHRVRQAVNQLASTPRPSTSKALSLGEIVIEVRRLRLERWRIIYTITDDELVIDVIAVRKRPPYDYGDLAELLADQK